MECNRSNRREFISRTGAWTVSAALGIRAIAAEKQKTQLSTPNAEKMGWRLACQLYTFRDRSFYEALDAITALGIRNVEPCFFLKLDKERPNLKTNESLSPGLRRELKSRLADRGIRMTNYYAALEGDSSGFRKIFDFAREMGVETLVAEPPVEILDAIEQLCNEYKINLAIHNHPQSPKSKYWRPENVLQACKGRSRHIGACTDTGHWVRSGLDPVKCLSKLKGRIITLHLKDVAESGNRKAQDVPLGTGKANYANVLKHLHAQGFQGVMTIEYEHLSDQLVKDVAKCLRFVEDVATSLQK
ncbi:MAG: sugar phosphate isomerase/epimerase family protein [Planctomycetota bacterium]|jgi:sugar phosphate isomerase/epimerase